jgi:predicted nucleic acid-binding protein
VSRFVLDASVVLTWCFPDEASQKAAEISERFSVGDRAVVTPFWRHEVLNAMLTGERRKRLTRDLTAVFIEDLNRLPIDHDNASNDLVAFASTQELCRRHDLTAYDAAYLEIAIRNRIGLATLDRDLIRAAAAENVTLL